MKYEITPTLINAWAYYMNSDQDQEASARESFIQTLQRVRTEPTEAMQDGIDFENDVKALCEGRLDLAMAGDEAYQKCIKEVSDLVRGGIWQLSLSAILNVNGIDFIVKGRLDILKGGWVMDLKYSHTFYAGKYRDNAQSSLYLFLVPESRGIEYIIGTGSSVATDKYLRADIQPADQVIREFYTGISSQPDLLKIYHEKWGKE